MTTMHDLALRLDAASDDLASLRASLTTYAFPLAGRGPAAELAARLDAAWTVQQQELGALGATLAELSAGVRVAAAAYSDVDGAR